MNGRIIFWLIVAMAIGAVARTGSDNIVACIFVGIGSSSLLMIIANLEVDKKARN
jgi:hypothetical protein